MMRRIPLSVTLLLLFGASTLLAQHRGDDLSFQGLSVSNAMSARALAVGGAYTAGEGELACLFYNPAGMSRLDEGLQLTITGERFNKLWRENQVYRPNRMLFTLPMYLERLYIPDPANNGRWDYDVWNEERDSTYVVSEPKLGLDPFSEEAADWQKKQNGRSLNAVALGFPLRVAGRTVVLAAAYGTGVTVQDYDRNHTYLDPHIGYDGYGVAKRVSTDTLRVNWYEYERVRQGTLHHATFGLAMPLTKTISAGIRVERLWGDTDDRLSLDKVGWFDLARDNRLRFSYDTVAVHAAGTSSFSTMRVSLAGLLTTPRLSAGLVLGMPHSLKRTWELAADSSYVTRTVRWKDSGSRKLQVPLSFRLGLALRPVETLELTFDYGVIPYSQGQFDPALPDTLHDHWLDQKTVAFGGAYSPFSWLTLMAGYTRETEVFSPDGNAFPDEGPSAEAFAVGFRVYLPLGSLDVAWQSRRLKYYDSYYSNTNYAVEELKHLVVSYSVVLW